MVGIQHVECLPHSLRASITKLSNISWGKPFHFSFHFHTCKPAPPNCTCRYCGSVLYPNKMPRLHTRAAAFLYNPPHLGLWLSLSQDCCFGKQKLKFWYQLMSKSMTYCYFRNSLLLYFIRYRRICLATNAFVKLRHKRMTNTLVFCLPFPSSNFVSKR